MYAYYNACSMEQRTLAMDDLNGIEALYPVAANTPPSVSILSPANNSSVPSGTPAVFSGTAMDAKDGDISSRLVWTSNLDGQIGVGGSFTSMLSAGTHTITAAAQDNGGYTGIKSETVIVAAACARGIPTISVSPVQTWVAPGATVSYKAAVTNTDAANCGASAFSLQAVVPGGWTGSVSSASVNLKPGQTTSTTLKTTAPAGTAAGAYFVGMAVSNGLALHNATASAVENVVSSLTVTALTSTPMYLRGQTVIMAATVLEGVLLAGNEKVKFTVTKPDGTLLQSWTPNTNGAGVATAHFTLSSTAQVGTYSITAVATSTTISGSASTTFSVQ
jgi:hypothetical protein